MKAIEPVRSGLCRLWSSFSRTPPGRSVNDHTAKIDVHTSIYYRLARKHFRRRIPRSFLQDATLYRFCSQFSDFFTLQRNELLFGVILVKLRTVIQSMNSRVISFDTRKCLGRRKILYFVMIFFSKVASATRSFSADGPTIVPASSRMIQSFFLMLS